MTPKATDRWKLNRHDRAVLQEELRIAEARWRHANTVIAYLRDRIADASSSEPELRGGA